MTNKKDVIIAVLATFCLASALFMILPSRSDPYDAWRDINDDGRIDMKDIGYTIKSFGTTGDSTKNVTIAGHANKLAYSIDNQAIPPTSYFTSDPISVDGYSKMVISIAFTEPEFDYYLWTGHDPSNFQFLADQGDETTLGTLNCLTYDVMNKYLEIRVRNPSTFEGWLDVDVYLIT